MAADLCGRGGPPLHAGTHYIITMLLSYYVMLHYILLPARDTLHHTQIRDEGKSRPLWNHRATPPTHPPTHPHPHTTPPPPSVPPSLALSVRAGGGRRLAQAAVRMRLGRREAASVPAAWPRVRTARHRRLAARRGPLAAQPAHPRWLGPRPPPASLCARARGDGRGLFMTS